VINKERKRFKQLLGGLKSRMKRRKERKEEGKAEGKDKEGGERLEMEEIEKVWRKLKKGKAVGNDGVPNEA